MSLIPQKHRSSKPSLRRVTLAAKEEKWNSMESVE
ncbi:hypothetical protein Enr13x_37190 [Stieleria neptunia]|uniref:Uncharacterized protein n=1 Tax=Stieleria neptunia TaxID=2527979 RepID=A0A518HSM8_9BACT|nr:hypothetical protein Enr13x_37190 [Stieleria neptunia]